MWAIAVANAQPTAYKLSQPPSKISNMFQPQAIRSNPTSAPPTAGASIMDRIIGTTSIANLSTRFVISPIVDPDLILMMGDNPRIAPYAVDADNTIKSPPRYDTTNMRNPSQNPRG